MTPHLLEPGISKPWGNHSVYGHDWRSGTADGHCRVATAGQCGSCGGIRWVDRLRHGSVNRLHDGGNTAECR